VIERLTLALYDMTAGEYPDGATVRQISTFSGLNVPTVIKALHELQRRGLAVDLGGGCWCAG
jgi:DNA-binding IclR family transcriptional regulator